MLKAGIDQKISVTASMLSGNSRTASVSSSVNGQMVPDIEESKSSGKGQSSQKAPKANGKGHNVYHVDIY